MGDLTDRERELWDRIESAAMHGELAARQGDTEAERRAVDEAICAVLELLDEVE